MKTKYCKCPKCGTEATRQVLTRVEDDFDCFICTHCDTVFTENYRPESIEYKIDKILNILEMNNFKTGSMCSEKMEKERAKLQTQIIKTCTDFQNQTGFCVDADSKLRDVNIFIDKVR